jgi:hypothetical protein
MLRSDQDLVDGWLAADSGEPFNWSRSARWREGFHLRRLQQACRRAWAGIPSMTATYQ